MIRVGFVLSPTRGFSRSSAALAKSLSSRDNLRPDPRLRGVKYRGIFSLRHSINSKCSGGLNVEKRRDLYTYN